MDAKCREHERCIYKRPSENCLILHDTKFNKPCPFRKEKRAARVRTGGIEIDR